MNTQRSCLDVLNTKTCEQVIQENDGLEELGRSWSESSSLSKTRLPVVTLSQCKGQRTHGLEGRRQERRLVCLAKLLAVVVISMGVVVVSDSIRICRVNKQLYKW